MIVIKIINHLLNFIVLSFFVIALSFSGYALYDVYSVYEDTELTDEILKYKPSIQGENSFGTKFSLTDLKSINKDIVGWIRIDNTNIDYPILAGLDNSQYLKSDYRGNYSPAGSIFLDYRNSRSLDDDYIVIYGHNMSKGLMFSDIKKFQKKDFFEDHSTGVLYTENGVYDLKIYTFNIIDANKSIGYKLQKYKNGLNQELIEAFSKSAIQKRTMKFEDGSKLILLSTCFGVGTYDRSVIMAKLIKKNEDSEFIHDDTDKIKQKEVQEFERKVIETEKRKKIVDYIIVLISYILIVGILYIRIALHRKKKKNKA